MFPRIVGGTDRSRKTTVRVRASSEYPKEGFEAHSKARGVSCLCPFTVATDHRLRVGLRHDVEKVVALLIRKGLLCSAVAIPLQSR
jgi:hypothetical protein